MRLRALVGLYTALWFGGLVWVAWLLLRAGLAEGFGPSEKRLGAGAGLAIVGVMSIGVYGLVSVFFWTEAEKARLALREGLGCQEAEHSDRVLRP
jgi:hypothetical protein